MKNRKKTVKKNLSIFPRWWIIGGVLLIVLIINLFSGDKILSMGKILRVPSPTPTPTPTPIVLEILPPSTFLSKEKYTELAINDLAKKLRIDKSNIKVISAQPHNFPDTSIGCPQKGKMYAQVITPGFVIKLLVLNKSYIYHGGLEKVVSCKS